LPSTCVLYIPLICICIATLSMVSSELEDELICLDSIAYVRIEKERATWKLLFWT
jgi:hypothetical protein